MGLLGDAVSLGQRACAVGKARQAAAAWARFVYAVDTHSEVAALAELEESGTLSSLWWENDSEWSSFAAACAAAGHRYVAAYDAPLLGEGDTGLVFRWVFDEPHSAWVELGRPRPRARGWAELVIGWRFVEPTSRND